MSAPPARVSAPPARVASAPPARVAPTRVAPQVAPKSIAPPVQAPKSNLTYAKPSATPTASNMVGGARIAPKSVAPTSGVTPGARVAPQATVASGAPNLAGSKPVSSVSTRPRVETRIVNNTRVYYRTRYIHSDPYSGNLNAFLAGALVTHMLVDGHRYNVYSNGNGGAYYMNASGSQVPLQPQGNGYFAEQAPITEQQYQEQAQYQDPEVTSAVAQDPEVQQAQADLQQAQAALDAEKAQLEQIRQEKKAKAIAEKNARLAEKNSGLGFWGWTLIIGAIGLALCIGIVFGVRKHNSIDNFMSNR